MNQDQVIILCFKIVEVASVVTIAAFIALYTRWARWWTNSIGRTIVAKDIALIFVLLPSVLSIFFTFNRLTSHIAGWFDLVSFAMVPVIMVWRTVVWWRIHEQGGSEARTQGGGTDVTS